MALNPSNFKKSLITNYIPSEDVETGQKEIAAFLKALSQYPQFKVKTIQKFEAWLFTNRHLKFSETMKLFLIIGDNNNGILFEIGDKNGQPLSCVAALRLLRNLLHHEFCYEADHYRRIVSQLDPESYLQAMKLHRFFQLSLYNARMDVFHILEALSQTNPNFHTAGALSNDAVAIDFYNKWKKQRESMQTSRFLVPRPLAALRCSGGSSLPSDGATQQTTHTAPACINAINGSSEASCAHKSHDLTFFCVERTQDMPRKRLRRMAHLCASWWNVVRVPDVFQEFNLSIHYGQLEVSNRATHYHMAKSSTLLHSSIPQKDSQPFQFFIDLAIALPFPAYVVAAVLFDHSAFIQEVLANPHAKAQLSGTQIKDLEALQQTHWFSKIRRFTRGPPSPCPLIQKVSYEIEISYPSQPLRVLRTERALHQERATSSPKHSAVVAGELCVDSNLQPPAAPCVLENSPTSSAQECFVISVTDLVVEERNSPPCIAPSAPPVSIPTSICASPACAFRPSAAPSRYSLGLRGAPHRCHAALGCEYEATKASETAVANDVAQCSPVGSFLLPFDPVKAPYVPRRPQPRGPTVTEELLYIQESAAAARFRYTTNEEDAKRCPSFALTYRISEAETPSCSFVSFEAVMNRHTACIFSSELLGESPAFFTSIWNIIYMCNTFHPLLRDGVHPPLPIIDLARKCAAEKKSAEAFCCLCTHL